MKKIGEGLIIFLFAFWSLIASAGVQVDATVDSNRVSLGEAITYTINVETTDSVSISSPRLPSLDGFNVINKFDGLQSRSTFVNGQFQFLQTYNFSFVLSPIRQGKLTIGVSEVVAGGDSYKTKPIAIEVLPPGAAGGKPRPRPQDQQQDQQQDPLEEDPFFRDADDLFSQLLKRRGVPTPGGTRTQPVNQDEAFFIQLDVDRTEVFEGEQITATYYLMTPYQVRDIDTLKYPSLKGFWKEDIEIATRLNFQREVINGVAYNKALLASYALFPLKAGKITIDPYKARCTIVTQMNMMGMGQPYQYTKSSKPVTVTVKPLPKDSQPQDFSGAVGQFTVSSRVENSRVPLNQPFALKVRIEGRGNAKVIELPPLQLPADLETYDTKTESKFNRDGTSFKEFEIFLIPRRQGTFTIPAISISSFDPEKAKFLQSQTSPIQVQVGEGRGTGETYQASPLAASPATKAIDRKKELPPPTLELARFRVPSVAWPIIWLVIFSGIFLTLYWKAQKELGWGEKRRSLKDRYQTRLKAAQKVGSDYRKLGAEGVNLVNLVLGEISQDGSSDAQFEKLILKAPPSVRRECEADLKTLVSYFESLAFAPEAMAADLAKNSKAQLKKLDSTLLRAIQLAHSGQA